MTPEEQKALLETVGKQAATAIKTELAQYETTVKKLAEEAVKNGGQVSKETFDAMEKSSREAVEAVKAICEKQGTTLAELVTKLDAPKGVIKSIAQVMAEDEEAFKSIYNNKNGQKTYMISPNGGMKAINMTSTDKTTGAEASVANIPTGAVSSITQALDAATLLRLGNGAMINNQYRNSAWIFDLCNTVNASFNSAMPYVLWFDEQPKVGASATVAEGQTKPSTQYIYQLNSSTYKKEATLIGFTEEFSMDFQQLESDIMNKGRIDVINRVNQAILPNIIAAATPYNSGTAFKAGTGVTDPNNFDDIAAMAAQVDNATFGARANVAVMSTNKKYRTGITKNTQGSYLNPPDVIGGIALIGNPTMDVDAVLVGDLKQYNIILRGGLIVRVGYNGTDFANNMFSVVIEQYYFDYISNVRKVAIVSGPNFADVTSAIAA